MKKKNTPRKINTSPSELQDKLHSLSPIPRHDLTNLPRTFEQYLGEYQSFDKLIYAEDLKIKPDFFIDSYEIYLSHK